MKLRQKKIHDDEESICLLTTLLVRYPELCTINYSPKGNLLKLSFILKVELDKLNFQRLNKELLSCVSTYLHFENGTEPEYFKVTYSLGPGITILEITRDTATLTQKEIALIINYLGDRFKQFMVSEEIYAPEDDLLEQDDFIGYMLDNLRVKNPKNRLIAVREEGRVLVFKR